MSHRELPRSGRGCVSAVVLLPVVALGGVLALVLTFGTEEQAPVEKGRTNSPGRPTMVSLRTTAPLLPDDPAALIGEPPERRTVQRGQTPTTGTPAPVGEVPPGPGVPPLPAVPGAPDVPLPTLPPSSVPTTQPTTSKPAPSPTTPPPTETHSTSAPPAATTPPTLEPTATNTAPHTSTPPTTTS